jgi:predicted ATPase
MKTFRGAPGSLQRAIPGYAGYHDPALRTKTDQTLRSYLRQSLEQAEKQLQDIRNGFQSGETEQFALWAQRTSRQLATVQENLSESAGDETQLFSTAHLSNDFLEKLYNYDFALLEQARTLSEELLHRLQLEETAEDIEDFFRHIEDLIDGLNQNLLERDFLLSSGGEIE